MSDEVMDDDVRRLIDERDAARSEAERMRALAVRLKDVLERSGAAPTRNGEKHRRQALAAAAAILDGEEVGT